MQSMQKIKNVQNHRLALDLFFNELGPSTRAATKIASCAVRIMNRLITIHHSTDIFLGYLHVLGSRKRQNKKRCGAEE